MNNSSWKDYAEIIGITAILGSLIFVGLQMRQDRVIAVANLRASSFQSLAEVRSDIIQHAEIWEAGLAGSELSSEDTVVFRNLAANIRMVRVRQVRDLRSLGLRSTYPMFELADLIRRYPGLAEEMAKEDERVRIRIAANSTELHPGPFRDQLHEAVELLNQLDPLTD